MKILKTLRTPLVLISGIGLLALDRTLIPNIILFIHNHAPENAAFSVLMSARLDYLLYLPNVVTVLLSVIAAFLIIEIKLAVLPDNNHPRWDATAALIGLALSILPLFFMKNLKGGSLQLLIHVAQVVSLWLFMMANGGLWIFNRFVAHNAWFGRLLGWTFPLSDIFFYTVHRRRLGAAMGPVRFVPSLLYAAILAGALGFQGRILWGSIHARRMPLPVSDIYWTEYADGGFWFSNGDWWDPRSGIWYYDDRSGASTAYLRAADMRKFYLEDGFFYFHDRYDNRLVKVDAKTRRVVWQLSTKPSGTYELTTRGRLIFAAGEGGHVVVVDRNGHLMAERTFFRAWAPQALPDGRVAFVAGDQRLFIWDSRLNSLETTSLPLRAGVMNFEYQEGAGRMSAITLWTDYDDYTDTLYIVTLWGEIFRYDVKHRRWLSSLQTSPGLRSIAVDGKNGLLFAWNYFQGYIDVMDLQSGRHLRYIFANALGRYINLDPVRLRGMLNTHGYGLYQMDYSDIVRSHPRGEK